MFTIGKHEIEKALKLGDFILCDKCGKRHRIKSAIGEKGKILPSPQYPTTLQVYYCGSKTYLVGVDGKDIRDKEENGKERDYE